MTPFKHTEDPTWRLIRRLGYAGLIPFVFLALCLWLVGPDLHPYVALAGVELLIIQSFQVLALSLAHQMFLDLTLESSPRMG